MNSVLLLHGALGASAQLNKLAGDLRTRGMDVHLMNFNGHAGIPFHQHFGIESFSADVEHFLSHEKLSAVNIFGYSMGGYVALWLAMRKPDLVNRIVTLGTKFDWSPESAAHETRKLNADKIQEKVPAFARILETRHAPNDWRLLLEKTASMMQTLGNRPLLDEDNLSKVQHNVMVLLGDQDDMADRSFSQKIADVLPNGEFKLLPSTPHPIEKVDLHLLSDLLEGFFRGT